MKTTALFTTALATSFFFSLQAHAWGPTGHRIVGEIAQGRLNSKTKRCLASILDQESLAHASNWADEIRSDPDKTKYNAFLPWHYIEIPEGKTLETTTPASGGNVLTALEAEEAVLKSKTTTLSEKREALKLLLHFIGDLHQPLHVGNGVDRGANDCFVEYFGNSMNLHALWDEGLIDHTHLGFTEYSHFLLQSEWVKDSKSWESGNYADWIKDSFSIRNSLYPKVDVEPARGPRAYCKKDTKDIVPNESHPKLGYDYQYQMQPILDRQLLKGGIRLASALNRIFKDVACSTPVPSKKKKAP